VLRSPFITSSILPFVLASFLSGVIFKLLWLDASVKIMPSNMGSGEREEKGVSK
jgi:hypothetical protein